MKNINISANINANAYENCMLCPRRCNVDRADGKTGACGVDSNIKVARAALHYWEEPCISGKNGSGAVFFSGCSLHCVFCQNRDISDGRVGKEISRQRLSDIFFELKEKGANNINLVTPGQYIPDIVWAVENARAEGFDLPIIYNTSGYENVESLKMLEGIVDIYLPDFKYMDSTLAKKYSKAVDYPAVAKKAVAEMVRQQPDAVFDGQTGLIKKGVIVRQLLLPGHVKDAKDILKFLYESYGNHIYISMMSQFTPFGLEEYPEINRRVTKREYERYIDYAIALGVENAFIQEGDVAEESFIPEFDCEGV